MYKYINIWPKKKIKRKLVWMKWFGAGLLGGRNFGREGQEIQA